MSENISIPAARVPLVDERGLITREWMSWFIGMFLRVGGTQGFSNQELYGDAVALQSYDELLDRIGALEANNRNLAQAIQVLGGYAMEQMLTTPPQAISPDTFAKIKVLGETDLATNSGKVRVGGAVGGSTAKLQISGDFDASGGARVRGAMQVDGELSSATYRVNGVKVVGARVTGIPAFTAYAGQTLGATYSQAQAQATDNAIKATSEKLASVVTALRTHGLVGD